MEDFDRLLDLIGLNIQMGDQTQARHAGGQHTILAQVGQQRWRQALVDIEKNNIGLGGNNVHAWQTLQAGGQALCQRMVLGQAGHMVVQRMHGRRRQYARLAQAPAQHLAPTVGLCHQCV